MFYTDIDLIRERINEAAAKRSPFLFAVNFELTEGFFIDNPLHQSDVLFDIKGVSNYHNKGILRVKPQLDIFPIPYSAYKEKFDLVHRNLKSGYSYLVNLTVKTAISTNLSLEDIFTYSRADYKLLVPDRFVCFSPERFVYIAHDVISTNPMKGTINASVPNAEELILNDFKETAEHNTIVDLLRNDLSFVANGVTVGRYRYIDRIKTISSDILQVSSEITGRLHDDKLAKLGDVLFGMLPAGSISGAPKEATLKIIREAENGPRGYYTGIFGYYDGNVLDTAVMIRFIDKEDNQLYFRSGGGITAYSNCESEYKEVLSKVYLPII